MTKTTSHIFSELHGSVKGDITFRTRKRDRRIIYSSRTTHRYTRTEKQDAVRRAYARLAYLWKTADWIDRTPYEIIALENRISPWNAFLMQHMAIMSRDPVLYIPLIEGHGNTAHDLSTNKNNGTIYGATWQHSKKGQNFLYFDGVDDGITVTSEQINNIVGNYSILILYKVKNNDKVNNLWTKKLDGLTYRYQFYAYQQNTQINTSDWKDNTTYCFNRNIYSNGTKLTFLGASRSETEGKIYLDGELKTTQPLSCVNTKSSQPLQIGYHDDSSWYFNGIIYFFALYNRTLSDAEIKKIYDSVTKFYKLAGINI